MHQRGLTLVEMLIALSVFALVGMASVGVLGLALQGQERVETLNDRMAELERARSLIRSDMVQVIRRDYRDPAAIGLVPSFIGGRDADNILRSDSDELILLAFVREGWTNPKSSKPRSSLQHVMYIETDGAIIRRSRPYVDAVNDTPYSDQVLFASVDQVRIRFKEGSRFVDDWRSTRTRFTPSAVRLEFEHPDYGPMTQDFLIGGFAR